MNIGKVIYRKRKEWNLTQEQLANKLGVSVPAVSKWETNISMPDIALLAPIARLFSISLDELMGFQGELSKTEIDDMVEQLNILVKEKDLIQANGYRKNLIHQYPNSEKLHFELSVRMLALANMAPLVCKEEQNRNEVKDDCIQTMEELMNSGDFDICNGAKTMVASYYMGVGRLDDAETLFKQMVIPDEWNAKRFLPVIYTLKEEYEKALDSIEHNIETDWSNLIISMRSLYNIVLKKQDFERAFEIARSVCTISDCFGKWFHNGYDMMLEVYLLNNDIENAVKTFELYIDRLIKYGNGTSKEHVSPIFFAEINREKEELEIVEKKLQSVNILEIMYNAITMDSKYECIREHEGYKKNMEKLRKSYD